MHQLSVLRREITRKLTVMTIDAWIHPLIGGQLCERLLSKVLRSELSVISQHGASTVIP